MDGASRGRALPFRLVAVEVFSEVFVEPRARLGLAGESPAVPVRFKPGGKRHARLRQAVRERHVVLNGDDAVHADGLRRRFLRAGKFPEHRVGLRLPVLPTRERLARLDLAGRSVQADGRRALLVQQRDRRADSKRQRAKAGTAESSIFKILT